MNTDPHSWPFQRTTRWRLLRRRPRLLWVLAAVVLLSLLLFWRPLQLQWLTYVLLRSAAPSPEVLSEVVNQTSDPELLLKRLWQTQRIPHRHFVLSYLGKAVNSAPVVFHALEPVMLDGARDADIETRELSFAALARAKHPQLRDLALEQLEDVDPAARILGLQTLRSIATSSDVPIAIRLLSDSEPRVVVAAALVLRQVTGQDVGIRLSHALPYFTGMGTNAPPPPDLNAIAHGVRRWQDWWVEHQTEYAAASRPLRGRGKPVGLTTGDFSLGDSNGKLVHLSDYHGKTVLLMFWSFDAPASLDAASTLAALQRENPERLTVLGVCVPPASSCADDHEHKGEHANHHHHGATSSSTNPSKGCDQLREMALEHKITYPMLLDSRGTAGLRFDVEKLPAYVLIDAQGMVCRRFVGNRSKQVLEAMIDEVSHTKAEHTATQQMPFSHP